MIDIHTHILPGMDDGAVDILDTIEMARLAAMSGVTEIVATPHFNIPGLYDNAFGEHYVNTFNQAARAIKEEKIPIRLFPGMEAFSTEDLPRRRAEGEVDVERKAGAALVGAKRRVVLNAVAAVDVILELIVHPNDAELDGALGLDHTLEQAGSLILGVGIDDGFERGQDLFDGLQKFGLIRVLGSGLVQNSLDISIHDNSLL